MFRCYIEPRLLFGKEKTMNVVEVVVVMIGILFFLGILVYLRHRNIVMDRYEWLEILSYDAYQSVQKIRERMETLKKKKPINNAAIYADLEELELEGLVTSRYQERKTSSLSFSILEYRRIRGSISDKAKNSEETHPILQPT
ncbi:MAG TPA: hypothetical protein VNF51_02795 [Candidatus Paceibacterota bacterium]|nr:hypothetical protein [Candidatus Paceibacterota bacterium]